MHQRWEGKGTPGAAQSCHVGCGLAPPLRGVSLPIFLVPIPQPSADKYNQTLTLRRPPKEPPVPELSDTSAAHPHPPLPGARSLRPPALLGQQYQWQAARLPGAL